MEHLRIDSVSEHLYKCIISKDQVLAGYSPLFTRYRGANLNLLFLNYLVLQQWRYVLTYTRKVDLIGREVDAAIQGPI